MHTQNRSCRGPLVCDDVWHIRSCWQPRLPDPSYAGPAPDIVPEDKSGTALAWACSIVVTFTVAGRRGHGHREERTMSHDKIKAAARRRMAATGEPYAAARRQVITEHGGAPGTSPVSADDVRAAAAAHRELGPEYSDAVVAAFIERVDRAVDARLEARLAARAESTTGRLAVRGRRLLTRRVARDVLAAGAGALVAVGAVGLHELTSSTAGPPAIGVPAANFKPGPAGQVWQLKLNPPGKVPAFKVVRQGKGSRQ
jgi:hypothetical protein